jgi:hypothetical protein
LNTVELLVLVFWIFILWRFMSFLWTIVGPSKPVASRAQPPVDMTDGIREAPSVPRASFGSIMWLKSYELWPERVSDIVVVGGGSFSLFNAPDDVRDAALRCYTEGRCRGVEFSGFLSGAVIPESQRLVFVAIEEGDLKDYWYALVAPLRYVDGVFGGGLLKPKH